MGGRLHRMGYRLTNLRLTETFAKTLQKDGGKEHIFSDTSSVHKNGFQVQRFSQDEVRPCVESTSLSFIHSFIHLFIYLFISDFIYVYIYLPRQDIHPYIL